MLGNSQLTFTISSSKIINKDRRYIIGFSHKEKLGYLNDDVLDFDFETYSMKVYKVNESTFKVIINNFPTQFIGAESEPTVTDLVLYEEEIQFINEKYLPNTIASKKYVDEIVGNTLKTTNGSNGTLALTTDKLQTSTIVVNTDIILPTVTSYTEIHLLFEGTNGITITTSATTVRWQSALTIESGKAYEVIFTYVNEAIGWLASYITYN